MAFTPRLTRPEAGNKYYNTPAKGGYAVGAILGKPTDSGCNVLANCVGYAAARYNEIIGAGKWLYFQYPQNAENFVGMAEAAGLKVSQTPELGAIIVWAKGKIGDGSDGAGHVAVVEKINSDGSIITSESGYGAKNPFWTTHREKGGGNWGESTAYRFLGFICQPEAKPRYIRKGDKGAAVELMQARLHALGYLRKTEIDGDFGRITLGAVLAFQFEHNLAVDGVCGPATQAALTI